jgi:type II secretory pathway component PulJ
MCEKDHVESFRRTFTMTKYLIPLAAAVSTMAIAAPASAQWYPQPQGYAQGHHNNYGLARAMLARVNNLQRQISYLGQRRMISRNEYQNLMYESQQLESRLRHNARDGRGFTRREAYSTERRIAWLEQKIARDVRDGRQWGFRW